MQHVKKEIPKAIRVRNTVGAGLITLSIFAYLAYLQYDAGELKDYWPFLLVIPAIGIPATLSYWFTKCTMEPTEETKLELAKKEAEAAKASADENIFAPIQWRWYYRYLLLLAVCGVGYWILNKTKGDTFWLHYTMAGAFLLYGLIIARELGALVAISVIAYFAWYFGKDVSKEGWMFLIGISYFIYSETRISNLRKTVHSLSNRLDQLEIHSYR